MPLNLLRVKKINNIKFKIRNIYYMMKWLFGGFIQPSPWPVKMQIIRRYMVNNATFIESGTYLGDTANYVSKFSSKVITLEPDLKLFEISRNRLQDVENIEVLNLSSEDFFTGVGDLSGEINFWLDGHFSGHGTYKNSDETPIKFELMSVEKYLKNFKKIVIFVDDFRLFGGSIESDLNYPSKDYLVTWSIKNGFLWTVEQDIFIATKNIN
jgi:hypothetical protein